MYRVYRVELEDTLDSIADKFNTTIDSLRQLNGKNIEDMIIPNNYIIVPKDEQGVFEVYKIKKGDTIYSVAKSYDVDPKFLSELNGLDADDYLYVDQEILVPKRNIGVYVTEQGDTIDIILQKTGKNIEEILEFNKNLYVQPEQLLIYKKEKKM